MTATLAILAAAGWLAYGLTYAENRSLRDRNDDQQHENEGLRHRHRARIRHDIRSAVRVWRDGVPGDWRGDNISVSGESRLTARQPGRSSALLALLAAGLEPWARADRTPLVGADHIVWDDEPATEPALEPVLAETAR